MWSSICIALIVIEALLFLFFVIGRRRIEKSGYTVWMFCLVFFINLAIYSVAFAYDVAVVNIDKNNVVEVLNCFVGSAKIFAGEIRIGTIENISKAYPIYYYIYLFGAILAFLVTISTAIDAFSTTISSKIRVTRAMKKDTCDIVIGNGKMSLIYAKNNDAVLIPNHNLEKSTVVSLINDGYTVLNKSFTKKLFDERYFDKKSRYNIICPDTEELYLDYINTFISYMQGNPSHKNLYLYVEVPQDKIGVVHREIIDKSEFKARIIPFCSSDLYVRDFVEKNPITKFLPRDFIEDDTSICPDVTIKTYILGFGKHNRKMYRQLILNNQLVKYDDGQYTVFPIEYNIYDADIDEDDWSVFGLKKALLELEADGKEYFPLPELPYCPAIHEESPESRNVINNIVKDVKKEKTFSLIVIDTGDSYRNIDIGTKLNNLLENFDGYHIFIRSDLTHANGDPKITYIDTIENIFTHDIIVNDSLASLARQLNHAYEECKLLKDPSQTYTPEELRKKAESSWNNLIYFKRYSNIQSALNIRTKLNLLGLDYVIRQDASDLTLLRERYDVSDKNHSYNDYFKRNKRNALIAQEHIRWNTYHLLDEFLPCETSAVTVIESDDGKPEPVTQNPKTKKHACLTTFNGLHMLSTQLAESASALTGKTYSVENYQYYINDEVFTESTLKVMREQGYSICELK